MKANISSEIEFSKSLILKKKITQYMVGITIYICQSVLFSQISNQYQYMKKLFRESVIESN